jgi:hypothetical protein
VACNVRQPHTTVVICAVGAVAICMHGAVPPVVKLGVGLAAVATIGLLDELEAQRLRVE